MKTFQQWWLNTPIHRWRVYGQVPHFLKNCPDPFRGEVLEIGAGKGWTSRRILETFPQVELTVIDTDAEAIAELKKLQEIYGHRLHVVQADAFSLPFDRASFDIVVALNVFRHFDNVTPVCEQLLRVIRPGGLLGVSDADPRFFPRGLRWLFSASLTSSRPALEEVLAKENSPILYAYGKALYDLWARKPYPDQN